MVSLASEPNGQVGVGEYEEEGTDPQHLKTA